MIWLRLRFLRRRLHLFFNGSSNANLVQMGIDGRQAELRANLIDFLQVGALNDQRLARVIVLQNLQFTQQIRRHRRFPCTKNEFTATLLDAASPLG